jgi:uncharacterized protein YqeY
MLDRLRQDIKRSLLAGDRFRAETLKMVVAALVNAQIAKRSDLTDQEITSSIQKEIKKRVEAAELYDSAAEKQRAQQERNEAAILREFVPTLMSGVDLERYVDEFLQAHEVTTFPEAMKQIVGERDDIDKRELAAYLQQKLAK